MCNDFEEDFAVYGEGAAGCKCAGEVAFDHGEDRFYLPALAVGLLGEVLVHLFAVAARDGAGKAVFSRAPTACGRDDADEVQLFPAVNVVGLALIARVGQKSLETVATKALSDRGCELGVIGLRPPVDNR